MTNSRFLVSSAPHLRSKDSINSIMQDVFIALIPASFMGVYFFGLRAILIIALSVIASVFAEYLYQIVTKQKITITDCSAAVTGLLLALNLPVSSPFWLPIVGSFFAIIIVKQLFGGLGQNFMNPALAARAFLLASYPSQMTNFSEPVRDIFATDIVSSATPLALLKQGSTIPTQSDYINAFIGNISGCIGETSVLALLLGGFYLIHKKIISWRIPFTYIGTTFVLTLIFSRNGLYFPFYELMTGGLVLGAFFMATDYSSSPISPKGQIIFSIGCALLTVLIRIYGGYPEGVSYSILLMSLTVPLIDKFTKPKIFGRY